MPALFLVCAACAPIPEDVSELPESSFIELDQTPFFPQEKYQCGPAALTTVLAMSGADVRLDEIVDKGLHEFLEEFILSNNRLGRQVQQDFMMSEVVVVE